MAKYLMAANGNDGCLWSVNGANQALRYLGNSSIQPEPSQALTGIAIANINSIFGISAAGEVYQLVNTPFQVAPWASMWHVATSADGSAWGWQAVASPTSGPMLDVAIGSFICDRQLQPPVVTHCTW